MKQTTLGKFGARYKSSKKKIPTKKNVPKKPTKKSTGVRQMYKSGPATSRQIACGENRLGIKNARKFNKATLGYLLRVNSPSFIKSRGKSYVNKVNKKYGVKKK